LPASLAEKEEHGGVLPGQRGGVKAPPEARQSRRDDGGGINRAIAALSPVWQHRISWPAARRAGRWIARRASARRLTMKASRILSALFVLLALACGSLAHAGDTDNAASGSSSNSNSSGGGY
jgi:hypothetical protein